MAAPTVTMQAPTSFGGSVTGTPSGTVYVPNAAGQVTVLYADIRTLSSLGFTQVLAASNLSATVDPTVSADNTLGYGVGSLWFNTASGRTWRAQSVATGAAVWLIQTGGLIGQLLSANMNVTTDQAFTMFVPSTGLFVVSKVLVTNASTSLTTAVGGVYDAAAKGGNALVANTQVYSALTTALIALPLTIALNIRQTAGKIIRLALSTPQGGAATADCYLYGDLLAQ